MKTFKNNFIYTIILMNFYQNYSFANETEENSDDFKQGYEIFKNNNKDKNNNSNILDNMNGARDREIVYLIEDKDRFSNDRNITNLAKIARVNGKLTEGGITEDPLQLSDYKLYLPYSVMGKSFIRINNNKKQDPACRSLSFATNGRYFIITRTPSAIETANQCYFDVYIDGKIYKEISILLNYTFKKWHNFPKENKAKRTAEYIFEEDYGKFKRMETFSNNIIDDLSPLTGLIHLKKMNIINLNKTYINELKENTFLNFE